MLVAILIRWGSLGLFFCIWARLFSQNDSMSRVAEGWVSVSPKFASSSTAPEASVAKSTCTAAQVPRTCAFDQHLVVM